MINEDKVKREELILQKVEIKLKDDTDIFDYLEMYIEEGYLMMRKDIADKLLNEIGPFIRFKALNWETLDEMYWNLCFSEKKRENMEEILMILFKDDNTIFESETAKGIIKMINDKNGYGFQNDEIDYIVDNSSVNHIINTNEVLKITSEPEMYPFILDIEYINKEMEGDEL